MGPVLVVTKLMMESARYEVRCIKAKHYYGEDSTLIACWTKKQYNNTEITGFPFYGSSQIGRNTWRPGTRDKTFSSAKPKYKFRSSSPHRNWSMQAPTADASLIDILTLISSVMAQVYKRNTAGESFVKVSASDHLFMFLQFTQQYSHTSITPLHRLLYWSNMSLHEVQTGSGRLSGKVALVTGLSILPCLSNSADLFQARHLALGVP